MVAKNIPKTATKIVFNKPTRNALKYVWAAVCSIKGKKPISKKEVSDRKENPWDMPLAFILVAALFIIQSIDPTTRTMTID